MHHGERLVCVLAPRIESLVLEVLLADLSCKILEGDYPEQPAVLDDRQVPNLLLQHQLGGLLDRFVGVNRDQWRRDYLSDMHSHRVPPLGSDLSYYVPFRDDSYRRSEVENYQAVA